MRNNERTGEALTLNEVALLAEVSERSVTKALEEGVLSARRNAVPGIGLSGQRKLLDATAVGYLGLMHDLRHSGVSITIEGKRRILGYVSLLASRETQKDLEFGGPIVLKKSKSLPLVRRYMNAARRYAASRDRWIVSDEAIMGGTPVIRGTRMTVYSVLGRVSGGDTIDEIAEENPDIRLEALAAALIYAKGNPMRGRPSGRRWHKAA
ncbi:MAG: DUF433 domain-containing protein [Sphingomonadales bacterium]